MSKPTNKDLDNCLADLNEILYDVYMKAGQSPIAIHFTFGSDAEEWADEICNYVRKQVKEV